MQWKRTGFNNRRVEYLIMLSLRLVAQEKKSESYRNTIKRLGASLSMGLVLTDHRNTAGTGQPLALQILEKDASLGFIQH